MDTYTYHSGKKDGVLASTENYAISTIPLAAESEHAGDVVRVAEEDLSIDQRARYVELCMWLDYPERDQVRTLGGYAGTGKTTIISRLAAQYDDELDIAYCAFTGKATNLLRSRLRQQGLSTARVSTLHSLLYRAVTDERTGRVSSWEPKTDVGTYNLVVVDEASMVNEELFSHLKSHGVPILAVGDHGQLPPVEGAFNLMEEPQLRLEKIHRQAEASPIIALSKYVREEGRLPASWTYDGQEVQIVSRKEVRKVLESIYSIRGIHPLDVGVLCFTNSMRVNLNTMAKNIWFNAQDRSSLEANNTNPRPGDTVICLRNVAQRIFNGMRGTVRSIRAAPGSDLMSRSRPSPAHYMACVAFPDDGLAIEGKFSATQFNRAKTYKEFSEYTADTGIRPSKWAELGLLFDFGYALTVHKSQGSGFKYVVLFDDAPVGVEADTYRRWLYTGITRSSEHLVILR